MSALFQTNRNQKQKTIILILLVEVIKITIFYLLGITVSWGCITIPLAVNGGVSTSSNGIHFPMGVVIVHHMEVSMPASTIVDKYK